MWLIDTIVVSIVLVWLVSCAFLARRGHAAQDFTRDVTMPLRGILVALVVGGHFLRIECGVHNLWIATYAVGVFMFISGYGTAKSLRDRGMAYLNGYLFRNSHKLLTPVLIVMTLISMWMMFSGTFDLRMILEMYARGKTPLCPHSWYVFELWVISFAFYFFSKYLKDWKLTYAIVCFVVVLGSLLKVIGWPCWWWISTGAYIVGFVWAQNEALIRNSLTGAFGGRLFLCMVVLMIPSAILGREGFGMCGWVFQACLGAAVVGCSYFRPIPIAVEPFRMLGVFSFEIYLVHGIVRDSAMRHLPSMPLPFSFVITFACAIVAALVLRLVTRVVSLFLFQGRRR